MIITTIFIIFLMFYNNALAKRSGVTQDELVVIKGEVAQEKAVRVARKIFIVLTILFISAIATLLLLVFLYLGWTIFTLGGAMYVDTHTTMPDFFLNLFLNAGDTLLFVFELAIYLFIAWLIVLIIKTLLAQIILSKKLKQKSLPNVSFDDKESVAINDKSAIKTSLKKTGLILVLIIAGAVLAVGLTNVWNGYRNSNKNLREVLDQVPADFAYVDSSCFFIYNDKIYYYAKNNQTDYKSTLYSMNLDGTENKQVVASNDLDYAKFYFVYNNEAYFSTRNFDILSYSEQNKKINLSTGKITDFNKGEFLTEPLKDGAIYMLDRNSSELRKIDLKTGQILSEIKVNLGSMDKGYYLDYANGDIYYLEDYKTESSDNFLQIKNSHYFYKDNKIYTLDVENSDNFVLFLDQIGFKPERAYELDSKIIFTEHANERQYSSYNVLGVVVMYDAETRETKTFKDVRKFDYDDNYLYIMMADKLGDYYVEKISR